MEDLHSLSTKLLDLLRRYEDGLKEDMNFEQARELRKKILELQATIQKKIDLGNSE